MNFFLDLSWAINHIGDREDVLEERIGQPPGNELRAHCGKYPKFAIRSRKVLN